MNIRVNFLGLFDLSFVLAELILDPVGREKVMNFLNLLDKTESKDARAPAAFFALLSFLPRGAALATRTSALRSC